MEVTQATAWQCATSFLHAAQVGSSGGVPFQGVQEHLLGLGHIEAPGCQVASQRGLIAPLLQLWLRLQQTKTASLWLNDAESTRNIISMLAALMPFLCSILEATTYFHALDQASV